jgi:3',5'-cyclic AMP phosphodiesterase CpdA
MRIAVLSDIHGNRTAFEAVLEDLKQTSPDLILHGGDLADAGASASDIVDRIRDLGWRGVAGNTDEMLFRPVSLEEFASQSSAPPSLWAAIRETAAWARTMLGEERIAWLGALPHVQIQGPLALVHASPESSWRARHGRRAMMNWNRSMLPSGSQLRSTGIFIVPTSANFQTQRSETALSSTLAVSVSPMTAIPAPPTYYWTVTRHRSDASRMTWRKN